MTYLAFARRQHDEPVECVGNFEADPTAAAQISLAQFPGDWVELTLVPIAAARWVIGEPPREASCV